MQGLKFYSLFVLLFIASLSFAKGHGGHGGGGHHGGGHHGGHSGARNEEKSSTAPKKAARSTSRRTTTGRTTAGRTPAGAANSAPVLNRNIVNQRTATYPIVASGARTGLISANGYYPREYYPNYYYGYAPYYYGYPYFTMWAVGMTYMNTPNYGYYPPTGGGYGSSSRPNNNSGTVAETEDGYAVYARDTIRGKVTLKPTAVLLDAVDSGRNYDYKFKIKQKELTCVTMYNDDNKELDLVRLNTEPKKLWRVVHVGKLNIYDGHHDFIYTPNDIDIRTLMIVYNREIVSLISSSVNQTKERLTEYVNKAYGTNLDAKKFSWNELLIYIDKLD